MMNLENKNVSARSSRLTAMLRSRMSRLSHTEFRFAHTPLSLRIQGHKPQQSFGCSLCNSSAFSLAEAMVMLVVVAIIMAVSAPLIAHKATADNNRLVIAAGNGREIRSAQGANQQFILGQGNAEEGTRLLVNGNETIKAQADGTTFQVTPVDGAVNEQGFKVFSDGTTNIRACVPSTDVGDNTIEDGFVVSNGIITVNGNSYYPPSRPSRLNCSCDESMNCNCTVAEYETVGNVIVPVAKNSNYEIQNIGAVNATTNFYKCIQPER